VKIVFVNIRKSGKIQNEFYFSNDDLKGYNFRITGEDRFRDKSLVVDNRFRRVANEHTYF